MSCAMCRYTISRDTRLARAGLTPIIFDKGRGIGGRMATKRIEQMRFDTSREPLIKLGDFSGRPVIDLQIKYQFDISRR